MRDLARVVAREHGLVHKIDELRASTIVRVLERIDAFRRPSRVDEVLAACEADHRGRLGFEARPYPRAARWRRAFDAARGVDAGAIARAVPAPNVERAIREARLAALRSWRKNAGR